MTFAAIRKNTRRAKSMIQFTTSHPTEDDNLIVVELSGKLDSDTSDLFFARLEQEVKKGHTRLIFDCHKLEYISSLGFGMMIRAHSRLQKAGGSVRFARLEGMLGEAFRVVGFHKLFDNHDSVEAAAASFSE
jgi:anti-anti-sigma factor